MLTKKTHAVSCFFTHAQSGNGWIDFNQIWHIDSLGGRSDIFEAASKLVQGFGRGRGAKFRLSHWLYHWLLTLRIALPRIRVKEACWWVIFSLLEFFHKFPGGWLDQGKGVWPLNNLHSFEIIGGTKSRGKQLTQRSLKWCVMACLHHWKVTELPS